MEPSDRCAFTGDFTCATLLVPGLAGVVVPKLDSAEQVAQVSSALDRAGQGDLPVVAGLTGDAALPPPKPRVL